MLNTWVVIFWKLHMSENIQPPIIDLDMTQIRGLEQGLLDNIPSKTQESAVVEDPSKDYSHASILDYCVAEGKRNRGSGTPESSQNSPRTILVGIASAQNEANISQDGGPGVVLTGDSGGQSLEERRRRNRLVVRKNRKMNGSGTEVPQKSPAERNHQESRRAYLKRTDETPEERLQRQRAYNREKQRQYRKQAKKRQPEAISPFIAEINNSELSEKDIHLLDVPEETGFPGRGKINSRGERVAPSGKVLPAKPAE